MWEAFIGLPSSTSLLGSFKYALCVQQADPTFVIVEMTGASKSIPHNENVSKG